MDHSIKKCPSKTPVPSGRYWASEKTMGRGKERRGREEESSKSCDARCVALLIGPFSSRLIIGRVSGTLNLLRQFPGCRGEKRVRISLRLQTY